MPKINKITKKGNVIYPLTIPQAVIDPSTGESVKERLDGGLILKSIEQTTESPDDGGTNVITVKLEDGTTREFHIKNGKQGNTGSSVEFPFELVNNVKEGGIDKALTAEMGKELGLQIGSSAETLSLTSTDFAGIAYNTNTGLFISSGPSSNGIIFKLDKGRRYECSGNVRICSEIPAVGKSSDIIIRSAKTFIPEDNEEYAFYAVTVSSFTSLTVTASPYGISGDIDGLKESAESVAAAIGAAPGTDTFTSDDFCGVSYNSSSEKFVAAGPSSNGIIIEAVEGANYKCNGVLRICTEMPSPDKTSGIVSRVLSANTEFTVQQGERYLFYAANTSSFTSLGLSRYGGGILRRLAELKHGPINLNEGEPSITYYTLAEAAAAVQAMGLNSRAQAIIYRESSSVVCLAIFKTGGNSSTFTNESNWIVIKSSDVDNWNALVEQVAQMEEKCLLDDMVQEYGIDDLSGLAYNTTSEKFIAEGPSAGGVIFEIKPGHSYSFSKTTYICSEIPERDKTSDIITRTAKADTDFTATGGETYAFIPFVKASTTTVTAKAYGSKILRDVEALSAKIEELDASTIMSAAQFNAVNQLRERELRNDYQKKTETQGYVGKWYGVEWKEEANPDNVSAINSEGDSYLHDTLPIQNRIRRCVTKNNVVQYYLNPDNSEYKADGTAANLDGTDGNVMVEIPEFFYKVEEDTDPIDSARIIRIKLSEDALPEFKFSCKRYTSAYEATINRETGKLVSVCTTLFSRNDSEEIRTESSTYIQGNSRTVAVGPSARRNGHTENAEKFRGGTNNSSFDDAEDPLNDQDHKFARNQLGIPVSYISRTEIRAACDENQFGYLYDTQRLLYMLVQVEYRTRNIQKSIANGGLGRGATRYPNDNGGYEAYEKFFAPQGGIACLPCGITNTLGNHSGEIFYLMENVALESEEVEGEREITRYGNLWMTVMSYRGIENYYGHIYKVADQVDVLTSPTTGYVEGHEDSVYWSLHDLSYWYEPNPYIHNIQTPKNFLGTYNLACRIMTVSSLMMGENGHILHIGTDGKDYGQNYCDCCEMDYSHAGYEKTKYITFNGRIVSGTLVGNHFIVASEPTDGSRKRPSDGTRLDHF